MSGTSVPIGGAVLRIDLVGAEAGPAQQTVAHGVGNSADVARGLENLLVGQDRTIETETNSPSASDLRIRELKRQKLRLKEEIEGLKAKSH
jgi:hypothetical protein